MRTTLSSRIQAAVAAFPGITAREHGSTRVLIADGAAMIVREGVDGDTLGDVGDEVDTILGEGAFAQLLETGTFLELDETTLDEPSQLLALGVDWELATRLAAAVPAVEPVATTPSADDTGFSEDIVFSQAREEQAPAASPAAPQADEVVLDLSAGEVVFATTRAGAPYAKVTGVGARTIMAFGEVAEAIRGQASVTCVLQAGRGTDKIVAVRTAANDLVTEARAA